MADEVIRSGLLGGVAHGFLDAAQSDAAAFHLVASGAPLLARQVHSARALIVTAPFVGDPPEVDALATATPGLVLGIRTADCAPVLLADYTAGVIGAAHAGWRGAFGGVIEAAVAAMEQLGATRGNIAAAIGPTIAAPSYEVDAAFRERLLAADPANATLFAPGRAGHAQFDLPGYVERLLAAAGVTRVENLALDTYADDAAQSGRFHSYRRATHRDEPADGRQYSLIGL
ncbi:MAG TPA: polyphenol oxidase family protein [Paracoccaceae bacterium]|nr:polyphenol oxidase family protein [Paracoccaceae bacterium]